MVTIRIATRDDNHQLIQLAASSSMAGEIGLRIDRKPDFFALLQLRGDTKVFVASENGQIIGAICVSLQQVYVGGAIFPLHYIGDFKVAEAYRNKGIGLALCNAMADYVIAQNADLAFLNVSKGNTKPLSFFRNRPNVPDFDHIGTFNIYQIIARKINRQQHQKAIEESGVNCEVLQFFNGHSRQYQLGPVLTEETFQSTHVFVIRESGKIIAGMALIDTMPLKQNVVTALSWKLKAALNIINTIGPVAGFSKMPTTNQPVKMMYIRWMAVEENNQEQVRQLIHHARHIAFIKKYSYVSIGLHEKDSLNKALSGIAKFTFRSDGMLLSIKDNRELIQKVKEGVPFEDYSLV